MLSRFSTVIQNAVDAVSKPRKHKADWLAPPAPLLEDFKYHWKRIMKYYVKRESFGKVAIECTNIPGHLDQLLKILIEEEGNQEQGSTGPCLEYLLHHHLLDLLATLACTDCPPGMKQITLCFVRKLITQLKQPVLPHVSVYIPIQRIVGLCNGKQASPTESYEIHFLCTLCGVICKHPQLINIFNNPQMVEDRRLSICSNLSSFSSDEVKSNAPEASTGTLFSYPSSDLEVCREQVAEEGTESSCAHTGEFTPVIPASPASSCRSSWCDSTTQKFFLLDTLLSYFNSADSRVVVKACEGVMVMASLQSDAFARSVTCHSDLCNVLTNKLDDLFTEIPSGIDPNDIDDIQVNWGLDSHSWSESTQFAGCKQVVAFFAWLDYCDQLVRESHPIISMALARSIRNQFFESVLGAALMHSKDYIDKVFIIAFISKCLKQISAPALLTEFHYWIIGESREPDLPGMSTCPVRQHLIENCFHEQDEISLEALRLFEVLLEKPSEHVLHCLVLVYLSTRAYYDCSVVDSFIESWSDEEDERERQRDSPSLDFSARSSPVSRTLAPSNIDKLLNSFLMLLPQHLHSTTDPDELGYEQYVQDADKQYQACITKCMCFAWPTEATFPDPLEFDAGSSDSRPEADHGQSFYEGPFLQMLFTRLVRLPHQPYEINLQLTGLVSRLAMLPHPYLHEYLLNPLLPLLSDASSLYGTLQLVANEVATQVPTLKNYKQLLYGTRQRLLGDAADVQEETNNMLESVVVLEEFCKELAAIAFVKYHHSS